MFWRQYKHNQLKLTHPAFASSLSISMLVLSCCYNKIPVTRYFREKKFVSHGSEGSRTWFWHLCNSGDDSWHVISQGRYTRGREYRGVLKPSYNNPLSKEIKHPRPALINLRVVYCYLNSTPQQSRTGTLHHLKDWGKSHTNQSTI